MNIKSFAAFALPVVTILGLVHFFLGSQQVLEINRLNSRIGELEANLSQAAKVTESAKKVAQKRNKQVEEFCKKYAQ